MSLHVFYLLIFTLSNFLSAAVVGAVFVSVCVLKVKILVVISNGKRISLTRKLSEYCNINEMQIAMNGKKI